MNKKVSFKAITDCKTFFTCVRAENLRLANKIEATHERSLVSVKVERPSTSRLSSALFILPLFYVIKIYLR